MSNSKYEFCLIRTAPWRFDIAMFEKKFIPFILIILQRNFQFFSRQATAEKSSILTSTYMVGLAYQFWLDLNNSLMFWNKLYVKKVNSFISYENNERTNFFSTQANSEILFDFVSKCHEEFWLWVSFHLNNLLTFWKKLYMKKANSLNSYESNEKTYFFLRKLDRKFFSI